MFNIKEDDVLFHPDCKSIYLFKNAKIIEISLDDIYLSVNYIKNELK